MSQNTKEAKELLDYIMFHGMLHKKHKFSEGRHHTKAFRDDEKRFGDVKELDVRLGRLISKTKRKKRQERKPTQKKWSWFGL